MKLFSPFQIKNMTLRNRVVMPPMCMYSAENGMPNAFHFTHYTSRAVGGVGLIIIEATGVLAPSAIPFDEKSKTPHEMDESDCKNIVKAFRDAAERAEKAGFDAVEIHAAHGYLLSEFLSPLTNLRTDAYGGSTENRCRLLIEVLKAVHEVWPQEKPVLLRVSAEDYEPDGMHPDEMAKIVELVKPYVDVLDVSTGGVVPTPPPALFPGYQVRIAEYLRQQSALPTITVGLITEPHHAEEILCNERADLVALGRALLREPYWVMNAARALDVPYDWPEPYQRGYKTRK